LTSQQLTIKIFNRLNKLKIFILLGGLIVGGLLFFYAKKLPTVYSVKSSLFPLTASPDKSATSSAISELIGGGNGAKSLSDEANVNIEEVAKSKKTREAVAMETIPEFNNKTIAELLIIESNKYKSYFAPTTAIPKDLVSLKSLGAYLLKDSYTAKFNKNSLLEIVYSNKNEKLITPVSYALVRKISQFYTELKIEKAKFDYNFTQKKVDSLDEVLKEIDAKRIAVNNRSLFVRNSKIQYTIPQENLENDKLRVASQKNGAASNREEALWRIQKVTPTIQILDTPEPPFDRQKPSSIMYGAVGFIAGCILFSLLFIFGLLLKFANTQVSKTIAEKLTEQREEVQNI
jgi:hypothetical protein